MIHRHHASATCTLACEEVGAADSVSHRATSPPRTNPPSPRRPGARHGAGPQQLPWPVRNEQRKARHFDDRLPYAAQSKRILAATDYRYVQFYVSTNLIF